MGLMLLTSSSFVLESREDIEILLIDFFETKINLFFILNDSFVQVRLFNFLSYVADFILNEEDLQSMLLVSYNCLSKI